MGNYLSSPLVNKKYGWVRDIPDQRDIYLVPNLKNDQLCVDLRDKCPGIYNQGKLGSCTANALAAAYEFHEIQRNINNTFIPSRLFIYYNERSIENTVNFDSGAQIRDGIKSLHKQGVCSENELPYDIEQFTQQPSEKCYEDALNHKIIKYHRVEQDIEHLKSCLASGNPIVFGFSVYESFESEQIAKTGIMEMPNLNEKVLGGHAVMAVGYNDDKKVIIVRNSWGVNWGDNGYFYMPYAFITDKNMCSDFWSIISTNEK